MKSANEMEFPLQTSKVVMVAALFSAVFKNTEVSDWFRVFDFCPFFDRWARKGGIHKGAQPKNKQATAATVHLTVVIQLC